MLRFSVTEKEKKNYSELNFVCGFANTPESVGDEAALDYHKQEEELTLGSLMYFTSRSGVEPLRLLALIELVHQI